MDTDSTRWLKLKSGSDIRGSERALTEEVAERIGYAFALTLAERLETTPDRLKIAVCATPIDEKTEPQLLREDHAVLKLLGRPPFERETSFLFDGNSNAKILTVGESYTTEGNWAGFPPHKHDDNNMPEESFMEELYFYRFDKPTGFGIQRVYTKEGDIDETYTVKNDDAVEIPRGYHPCTCAPGYKLYYLWIMAGKIRGFHMTTDEDHKWLNK